MDHVAVEAGRSFRELAGSFPIVAIVMQDLLDHCRSKPIDDDLRTKIGNVCNFASESLRQFRTGVRIISSEVVKIQKLLKELDEFRDVPSILEQNSNSCITSNIYKLVNCPPQDGESVRFDEMLKIFKKDPEPNDDFDDRCILWHGEFGIVYRMRSTIDSQLYSIKTINTERATERGVDIDIILEQLKLLQEIKHSNIIKYCMYNFCSNLSRISIVMGYKSGTTLGSHIGVFNFKSQRPIFVKWLRQCTDALICLHKRNIVHRNLNPNNIIIDSEGDICILDIAIEIAASKKMSKLSMDLSCYHSYEKVNGLQCFDKEDVWSASCIFIELLLGIRIGTNISQPTELDSTLRRKYLILRCSSIDEQLGNLFSKTLVSEQKYRFDSVKMNELVINIDATRGCIIIDSEFQHHLNILCTSDCSAVQSSLSKLHELSDDDDTSILMCRNGIISAILPHLLSPFTKIKELSIIILWSLTRVDDNLVLIYNSYHLIQTLLFFIAHETQIFQEYAANIFYALSGVSQNQNSMYNDGVVKLLCPLLRSTSSITQECIVGTLSNLAACAENRVSMYADGVAAVLFPLLDSAVSVVLQEYIASALCNLAAANENSIHMYSAANILMKFIPNGSELFQVYAIGTLASIAVVDVNKVKMRDDVISILLPLFTSGSVVVKEKIALVFCIIAEASENQIPMFRKGVIKVMVSALETGTAALQENITFLLLNVVMTSENLVPLYQEGIVKILLTILPSGTTILKENIVCLLRDLATAAKNQALMNRDGVLRVLLRFVTQETTFFRENLAACFCNLAVSITNKISMYQQQISIQLIKLLPTESLTFQKHVLSLLCNLAMAAENQSPMCRDGTVVALIQILSNSPISLQEEVTKFISIISESSENQVPLYRSGIVKVLLPLLAGGSDELKENAVIIFAYLAVPATNKVPIYNDGVVSVLLLLFADSSVIFKEHAALVIYNLSVASENEIPMYHVDRVVKKLLPLLVLESNVVLHEYILGIICNLATASENQNSLWYKDNVIEAVFSPVYYKGTVEYRRLAEKLLTTYNRHLQNINSKL